MSGRPHPLGEHPVLAAQRRLVSEFARSDSRADGDGAECAALLQPLLDQLGWNGAAREIAEAMPHRAGIEDAATLRAVLSRLGVQTPFIDIAPREIGPSHCPCLVEADGALLLVACADDAKALLVYDGAASKWRPADLSRQGGVVRIVRLQASRSMEAGSGERSFVWRLVSAFRRRMTLILWQSGFISLFGLLASIYSMLVFDKVISTRSLDTLAMFVLGVAAILVVELKLRAARGRQLGLIAARFDAVVATSTLEKVLSLPISMSESAPLEAQLGRFSHFQIGRELFASNLATSLIDLPFTLLFLVMLFVLGGDLGMTALALVAALVLLGVLTAPFTARRNRDLGESKAASDAVMIEIATRMRTIRDNNAEDIWHRRATDAYGVYLAARFRCVQSSTVLQNVAHFLVSVCGVAILSLGAVKVMQNTISVGALVALMMAVWRVLGPIQNVFLSLHKIKMLMSSVRQIETLMALPAEAHVARDAPAEETLRGAISFSNVYQRYGNRADPVLRGLSLEIRAGEFVTLAGASGSGKSALLKSALGLYAIQNGAIRIDGLDLRQLDLSMVRRSIGYLPQNPILFHGTVAQNLRLSAPDASDRELVAALASMGIAPNHPMLPDGVHTPLSAITRQAMSPSFVQRLALACVFVRERSIFLFDDASTHLDNAGDLALMAAIQRLKGRSTIIMATARPSHMRASDRVVVLKDGQVVRDGPPDAIVPHLMSATSQSAA
ncbi:MAG: ATP-binding cassette domain-containing protein [Beijerinckiaceae bacterium]|nr:ATP-binding cassette domain-containing protein [Beijerinckiaceae bacterium]